MLLEKENEQKGWLHLAEDGTAELHVPHKVGFLYDAACEMRYSRRFSYRDFFISRGATQNERNMQECNGLESGKKEKGKRKQDLRTTYGRKYHLTLQHFY